jgi:ABC-type cobalamin/Fe3+-siderophores transport system ATPase subunit
MTVLSAEQVSLRFGNRDAVDAVSLKVRAGEFVAVLGPNGAGKTSLLRIMAGLARPTRGRMFLDDRPLAGLGLRERGRRIAFLAPARIGIPSAYRVDDVIGLARFAHRMWWQTTGRDDPAVDHAVDRFGLEGLRDRRLGTLSDGERQRVWLAALEARDPEVLLLDEPTSHLDVAHVADTLRALRGWAAAGRAVVAVLHDLDAALAAADRIVVLQNGHIVRDTPRSRFAPSAIGEAFGVTFAASVVARRQRGLVVDYEADR